MRTMITDIDYIRDMVERKLKERKISVYRFAKDSGLQQPTLHRFLKGQTVPTISNMNKILDGLLKIREM